MADTNHTTDEYLKSELLRLDVQLRRKQSFWETPRALLLIVATTAAAAGLLGWGIGSAPPQQIIVHLDQPLVGR
jgi:hypothetical protein